MLPCFGINVVFFVAGFWTENCTFGFTALGIFDELGLSFAADRSYFHWRFVGFDHSKFCKS